MLLVKTYIAPSPIHGYGLFAAEAIPIGAVIWQFLDGFDDLLTTAFVATLPPPAREYVLRQCPLLANGRYLHYGDNSRFINHSFEPSAANGGGMVATIATRKILPGEEITEDYSRFDPSSFEGFATLAYSQKARSGK